MLERWGRVGGKFQVRERRGEYFTIWLPPVTVVGPVRLREVPECLGTLWWVVVAEQASVKPGSWASHRRFIPHPSGLVSGRLARPTGWVVSPRVVLLTPWKLDMGWAR